MKVLISAYACEPNRGSEPEIGWQWATHLAQVCDVTVITRANNALAINQELGKLQGAVPEFVYIDLSWWMLKIKKLLRPQSLAVAIYYTCWQRAARRKIADLCESERFDVLHHSTFGGYRLAVAVTNHGVPSLVGPVGGCENFPRELMPDGYLRSRWVENLRNFLNHCSRRFGYGMGQYQDATKVLACTREMDAVFKEWNIDSEVMANIGMIPSERKMLPERKTLNEKFRLLFVGRILCWKGLELIVKAVKLLPENVILTIVGDGPDIPALRASIRKEGLDERVELMGSVTRSRVLELYEEYDVFFFPSMHDSGGFVVLEAMSEGLPVICLDRGGPALAVEEDCGIVVPAGNKSDTVSRLVSAVHRYMADPDLLEKHGKNAISRIHTDYSWSAQTRRMQKIYSDLSILKQQTVTDDA